MRTPQILLAFAFLGLASASPLPSAKRASAVNFFKRSSDLSPSHKAALVQRERAKILRKYGKSKSYSPSKRSIKVRDVVHYDIVRRAGESGTDSMLDDYEGGEDSSYSGPIEVGTPSQMTTVQFDTGSSDLAIPSSACSNCTGPLFDPSKSTTFVGSDTSFNITYADNSGASGLLAVDTVSVAGLTVPQQTFAVVSFETPGFADPYAGILGLGFLPNAESGAVPWFANLVATGVLESNIFSFYMTRGGANGSELCIGCVNSDKFTGKIEYYPVVAFTKDHQPSDWDIQSTGLSYKGSSKDKKASEHKTWTSDAFATTIDSGTTLAYVSTDVAKAFYAQIPNTRPASSTWGAGAYALPCSNFSDLGKISFGFGGKDYELDPVDFNAGPESEGSSDCVTTIIGTDLGGEAAVLGDIFMKSWYSVFDYGGLAIGFAKAV